MNRRHLAISAALSIAFAFTACDVQAQIIPANRRIIWEGNIGIPDGVPNRTTISATINASTYGNGTTDATNANPNRAEWLPGRPGRFCFPPGHSASTRVSGFPSNVTLRGAGPNKPYSTRTAPAERCQLSVRTPLRTATNSKAITGGTTAGSNTITLASASRRQRRVLSADYGTQRHELRHYQGRRGELHLVRRRHRLERHAHPGPDRGSDVCQRHDYRHCAAAVYQLQSPRFPRLPTPFSAGAKYAGLEDLQVYMNNTGYTTNFHHERFSLLLGKKHRKQLHGRRPLQGLLGVSLRNPRQLFPRRVSSHAGPDRRRCFHRRQVERGC